LPYILEGIATTQNAAGETNVAPMGPIVSQRDGRQVRELIFRPFPESTTFRNLQERPEGVFHVTDDVLLFAKAVTGQLVSSQLAFCDSTAVEVPRLADVCGWMEFRVRSFDNSGERPVFVAEVIASGNDLPWMGFNRAQATVLETAILATRLHILPHSEVETQLPRFRTIVEKTADERTAEAFAMLERFIIEQTPEAVSTTGSAGKQP